jgi:hypothetical protein
VRHYAALQNSSLHCAPLLCAATYYTEVHYATLYLNSNPPGDYHLNVNMQESYWAADVAGVREAMPPLLSFIEGDDTAISPYLILS